MRVPLRSLGLVPVLAAALALPACVSDDMEARLAPFQGQMGWPDPPAYKAPLEQQVAKALRFLNGDGVERDTDRALELLLDAAKQGNGHAGFLIGRLFEEGVGLPQDKEEALNWIEKAATNGYPEAQYRIGMAYNRGEGRPLNSVTGVRWFQRAAFLDHAGARYHLGVAYHLGRGIKRDEREAVHWLELAAEQGHAPAQVLVGDAYADGWGVERADESWAARWYALAASQGVASAQYKLGLLYLGGTGVPRDRVEAYKWLALAATAEMVPAIKLREKIERQMAGSQIKLAKQRAQAWQPAEPPPPPLEGQALDDRPSVLFAQYALVELGYKPGQIDGNLGMQTRHALGLYQGAKGLGADGRLSYAVLRQLKADRLAKQP